MSFLQVRSCATFILAAAVAAPSVAGFQAARRSSAAASDTAPALDIGSVVVRHNRIRLATGVELHVAQTGPEDGVPIVLLHGFTDSWFSWSPVLERLPPGVRAIVPTQRGHGDSERPMCCYQLADFARDVVALLDALGIQRAHVIGHSMGALIAQRVAIETPERVDRLVIVSAGASAHNDVVVEFNEIVQQLTDPVAADFILDFQAGTTALPLPSGFLDEVVRESGKLPARIWRDVLGSLVAPEAAHDPSRIQAPTLIVWGAQDALFPRRDQDSLVRAIADARLIVYPEAAHAPNWEMPDRLADDVAAFLGVDPMRLPDATDRFLDLTDVSLRYRDLGGAGDVVVLLHGYSNDIETWTDVADSLRADYRVIALDLRGFGRSRSKRADVRYGRAMASDVVTLLDSLAIPQAHIVGFSLGGLVAASVARAAPDRVATLTLLAPPMYADSAALTHALAPFVRDIELGNGLTSFFQWVYPNASNDAMRRTALRAEAANDRTALFEVARQMGGVVPDATELRQIVVPTIVVVGTDDPFMERGRYAVTQLPNARLILMPGGNHGAVIGRPSWLAAFRASSGLMLGS